jgi:hypothetical protein
VADTYNNPQLDSPALHAKAVTPDDTNNLKDSAGVETPCRALYIGTTGNVVVNTLGGENNVLHTAVPVGVLPIRCTRVLSTNTNASNIVAWW